MFALSLLGLQHPKIFVNGSFIGQNQHHNLMNILDLGIFERWALPPSS
jgi:hypothetical protein